VGIYLNGHRVVSTLMMCPDFAGADRRNWITNIIPTYHGSCFFAALFDVDTGTLVSVIGSADGD
jgi:hypothetical protein